jgi:hypothetical protein
MLSAKKFWSFGLVGKLKFLNSTLYGYFSSVIEGIDGEFSSAPVIKK